MSEAVFTCPKCKTSFLVQPGTVDTSTICAGCASALQVHFFPAFFRPAEVGLAASNLLDPTEASCFYHPQKQAARVCDGCGRLVCALCSIDMGEEHLCPSCISTGKKKGTFSRLENARTRYDSIALSLAVVGLFASIFSIVLCPASIYVVARYWNAPVGVVGRGRTRMIVALIVAIFALVLWGGLFSLSFLGAFTAHRHHHA